LAATEVELQSVGLGRARPAMARDELLAAAPPLVVASAVAVASASANDGAEDDGPPPLVVPLLLPRVRLRWRGGGGGDSFSPRARVWLARARLSVPTGLLRDPLFMGHALNVVFMVLYSLLDFFRAWDASNAAVVGAGLIALGFGFLLDAALYLLSWNPSMAPGAWPTGAALAGEALNLMGSALYAATSVLYLYEPESAFDTDLVFGMEAVSTLVFLLDAVVYFVVWYAAPAKKARGKGCNWRDLDLWSNLLNVAAALIYVVAAANGLLLHFSTRSGLVEALRPAGLPSPLPAPTPTLLPAPTLLPSAAPLALLAAVRLKARAPVLAPLPSPSALSPLPLPAPALGEEWSPTRPSAVLREMARVYVWGDVVWTIDALFFLAAWARDSVGLEFDEGEGDGEGEGEGEDEGGAEARGANSGGALFSFGKSARAGGDAGAAALRESLLDGEAPGGAGAGASPALTRGLQ